MLWIQTACAGIMVASVAVTSAFCSPPQTRSTVAKHASIERHAPKQLKIVAFGSSSTEGVGASEPGAAYPAQLERILKRALPRGMKISVVNRGIGGEDADDMAKRLRSDVIARRPNLVIWQTGSNDPMRKVPLDRFEEETRDGIAQMQEAGIEVILMEPQWCPHLDKVPSANLYRDVVRKVGAEFGLTVIRRSDLMHDWVRQGLMTETEMLAADGLHMRDKGYAMLARAVANEIITNEIITNQIIGTKVMASR